MSQLTPAPTLPPAYRQATRCYVVGMCDGLPDLLDRLEGRPDVAIVGAGSTAHDAGRDVAQGGVDVVLLATSGERGWVDELSGLREHTAAPVLLVSTDASEEVLETALETGVEDVLLLPEPLENVVFAIRRAGRSGRRQAAAGEERLGRTLTVFSPKGGTGKTVLATSLAASYAQHQGRRTLLLDLDLQFGDAALALGCDPQRTVADLVSSPGTVDAEKLAAYVLRHPTGVELLPAPLRPEDSELIGDEQLAQVLEAARAAYEVVVVDTTPLFHGALLTALDWTDVLLLVCGVDVTSLKNVHLSLRTLSMLSFPPDRIRVVLNRAHSAHGLKRAEVQEALGLPVAAEIPYDKAVVTGINEGIPAALDGRSDFARAVREMAETLLPAEAAPGRRDRFWSRRG